jgi:hypothetical protein
MAYKYLSIILIIFVFGCGHTQSSGSYRVKPSFKGLESHAKIAVVLNNISGKDTVILEKKLNENIQATFDDLNVNIKMIPPDEVRKLAFPNLTPDKSATIQWHKLINDSAFRDSIESLALRYMILIELKLKSNVEFGEAGHIPYLDEGYGAVGWFQTHSTGLVAKIIDLSESREIAEAQSEAEMKERYGLGFMAGSSGYGAYVIPFPIISPEGDHFALACKELAEHIAVLFTIPSYKKIKRVKYAVKQENGDIEICVEFDDSSEPVSSQSYILTLPLSSLKGPADLSALGFRKEDRKGNTAYYLRYGRVLSYIPDDIDYYLYPIERAKKGCEKISSGSPTIESVLPVEKLTVDLEKINELSILLNGLNEEHPYLERVYEVTFVSEEEATIIKKADDETDDELAKHRQEIRLIYCPPQIIQEATYMQLYPIGVAGGYDREDQDANF